MSAEYKTIKVVTRVFYVNVDGVSPGDVAKYIDSVKEHVKSSFTGGKDRFEFKNESMQSRVLWEDIYIPTRMSDTRVEVHEVTFPW